MSQKKARKAARISAPITPEVAKGLDKEVARVKARNPGTKPTRSSVARAIVKSALLRKAATEKDRKMTYEAIVHEATELKTQAEENFSQGRFVEARSDFLLAASRELEALSILGVKDESATRSTVIQTLLLLKRATGYRNLPDLPTTRETSACAEA